MILFSQSNKGDLALILIYIGLVFGLPILGYCLAVIDFRAYLRAMKGALIVVKNHLRGIPEWAREYTPGSLRTLGLEMPCTEADVKRAYRKLAEKRTQIGAVIETRSCCCKVNLRRLCNSYARQKERLASHKLIKLTVDAASNQEESHFCATYLSYEPTDSKIVRSTWPSQQDVVLSRWIASVMNTVTTVNPVFSETESRSIRYRANRPEWLVRLVR